MPDSRTGADSGERRRSVDKSTTRRIVSAPTFQVAQVISLVSAVVLGALWVQDGHKVNSDAIKDGQSLNAADIQRNLAFAQLNAQAIEHEAEQREIVGGQLTTDVQELREEVGTQAAAVNAKLDANHAKLEQKLDALIEREIRRLESASAAPE